jgi:diguanylate cyclase (GGDEF)-like protein
MVHLFRLPQSLIFRITVVTLLIILAAAIIRTLIVRHLFEATVHEYIIIQQQAATRFAAQEIDDQLLKRKNLLLKLADEFPLPLIQRPKILETWLASRHTQTPIFSMGLVFIPSDGQRALADFPSVEGRREVNFSAIDWFLAARDKGHFFIGKPMMGKVAQEAMLHMAVPIKNDTGQVLGVLMGATQLSMYGFLDLIGNGDYGKPSDFSLLSPKDQIVVLDSQRDISLRPVSLAGVSPLYDRAVAGWRGSGSAANSFGIKQWETYVSVPTADWLLVGRVSASHILSAFNQTMAVLTWLNLAAVLITASFVTWLIFVLLKPLKKMTRKVHLMAAGEIPLQKLSVVHEDEVGSLIDSFNALVDQLQETQERLQHLAHHDVLTQLPNRRMFIEDLAHSCALALRQSSALALLFIDLDGFKRINDQYGHAVGDLLLKQVADRLNEGVRKSDRVARLGGDEFVVVLMDCKGRENLVALAGKWIARLSKPYSVNGQELRIGASIGIGVFPDHAGDADTLVAKADAAMYEAKRAGANTYRFVGDQV